MSKKNSNDTIGNRTCDLLACRTVPKPTVPPCAPPYTQPHSNLYPSVSASNTTNWIHLNNPHILRPFNQNLGFLHFTLLRGNFWSEKWKSLLQFLCPLKTFYIPEMLTQSFLRNSSACGWSCSTACATSITNSWPLWYLEHKETQRIYMGVISNSFAVHKPQFLALICQL